MSGPIIVRGAAGGSGGGQPPKKPDIPQGAPDDNEIEDEEVGAQEDDVPVGRRIQCPTCLHWVLRSNGLARHASKCVGHRHFSGSFACIFPGCKARRLYYHDLTKHWRKTHPRNVPDAMSHKFSYF